MFFLKFYPSFLKKIPSSRSLDLSGCQRRVLETTKDSQLKTPTQIRKASSDSETPTPKSEKIIRKMYTGKEVRKIQKASVK